MDERQPHRPNYAELDKAHEEAQQPQRAEQPEQQHEAGPTRPEGVNRGVSWPDSGDMVSQQRAALEQNRQNNQQIEQTANWKQMLKDPEYLREVQEQFREQQAKMLQRENEGPQHDHPGGRER